jgi:hypothetical protein
MTTATKTNALESIAATMRSHVVNAGAMYSHQRLPRGLEIVLQRHIESNGAMRWRLALGRTDVAPSEDEIAICRKAFGVPIGTEHSAVQSKSRYSKKSGIVSNWHIVEMYWYEA